MQRFFSLVVICVATVLAERMAEAVEPAPVDRPDVTQWALPEYDDEFFNGRAAAGEDALNFWMQSATYRADPVKLPRKRTIFERLWSNDPRVGAQANQEIVDQCKAALANIPAYRVKGGRSTHLLILLALRARPQLTPEALEGIVALVKAVDLTDPATGYIGHIEVPGANGANVHGHLTPLVLGSELIHDDRARWAAYWGFRRELDHMNSTGDVGEFNLLESHWTGTGEWEVIARYCSDPNMRRMARLIQERLWINRFLTWSSAVERITGPGSRMAPSEWLGCDNERCLLATGMRTPIWLNIFYPWGVWNARNAKTSWPLQEADGMVPQLPAYLQDLASKKAFPNALQCAVSQTHWNAYPKLDGVAAGDLHRPMKYVNYQTENYAIGSSTSSWVVNTCYVGMCAFWNNSRNTAAPLGSPDRFCALYPHYVMNGMSFLDKGSYAFADAPNQIAKDDKGGVGGPWMREFVEWGRMGIVQDRNTMLISYTSRPGHHLRWLSKPSIQRASAGMFLFRSTEGTDGLYINREPIRALPAELQPGDCWFIEDGDVYAAVRPLTATHLRGNCKTILEKRTRHIVLYQDNVVGDNIEGISDEDWIKARSGFVVEMGNKGEYGSFVAFRDQILAGAVRVDDVDGYTRHVAYDRGDRQLDMRWHCYTEEYASRQINGRNDPWPAHLQSPEFAVGEGSISVKDATLATAPGNPVWLLSCAPSSTWVAYQTSAEQELPIDFNCPAGRVTCKAFPLGKIAVTADAKGSVSLVIDASYRPFFGTRPQSDWAQVNGGLPTELLFESPASAVTACINGIDYKLQRQDTDGKPIWRLNPYDNARALAATAMPRSN